MPKSSLHKNNIDSINNKGVHTFPKSISPKVNIRVQLEFKLTYFKAIVQHFSHYTMGTSPSNIVMTGMVNRWKL